jgi:vanillate O-demethylase ferredoxin subunit
MTNFTNEPAPATIHQSLQVVIARRKVEADGIISLELRSASSDPLPSFDAGSHVDVTAASNIVRQYSLSSDPAERDYYRLAILLEPQSRGGSLEIHRSFMEGQVISISAPRNNFPLTETAGKSILIAGGIGITPLLAMAYRLANLGRDFEMHYCVRTKRRAAFEAEIARSVFSSRVMFHYDDGLPEQLFSIDACLSRAGADTHVYVCGPQGFMDYVVAATRDHSWTSDHVHLEYFSADINTEGDSFTVVAARTGKSVEVHSGMTIATALQSIGIDVLLSCQEGVCGTCLTNVLEGTPDHRDLVQSEEEKADNRQITVCCSRARSKTLVLDI